MWLWGHCPGLRAGLAQALAELREHLSPAWHDTGTDGSHSSEEKLGLDAADIFVREPPPAGERGRAHLTHLVYILVKATAAASRDEREIPAHPCG